MSLALAGFYFLLRTLVFYHSLPFLSTVNAIINEVKEKPSMISGSIALFCWVMCYIMGLGVKSGIATLVFEVIGWFSYLWFALAFIPDARDVVYAMLTICC